MKSCVAGCIEVVWSEAHLSDMWLRVDVGGSSEERHHLRGEREKGPKKLILKKGVIKKR
jgi:hypothetical protein